MSKIKRMLSGRTALALAAWVVYVLAFAPLYRLVGAVVAALVVLPVVMTGRLFGMRAGLLASLLTFPLNVLLTTLVGGTGGDMMTPAGVLGSVVTLLVGVMVGRLRDLGEQVKRELAERKQAQEALRESEERLRHILDFLQTGVAIIDAETHVIVDANPAAVEMLGVPKERIVGQVCHRFICPAEVGQCPITDLGQVVDRARQFSLNRYLLLKKEFFANSV